MSDATVEVTGLSPDTTQEGLTHFFSFCGKIKSVTRTDKSATVVFEKASAAKTSLMLDGGSLDNATIHVSAATSAAGGAGGSAEAVRPTSAEGDEVNQEDKPRSAIAAEYVAHGYVLGDSAIAKAIELDSRHGISAKFLSYFKKIDEKYQVQQKATAAQSTAQERAVDIDNRTGASSKLGSLFSTGRAYYEKALASPQGAKVREFYTSASKQVLDVHAEAKRIAEEKAGHPVFQHSLGSHTAAAADGSTTHAAAAPAAGTTGAGVPTAAPVAPQPVKMG